MSTATIFTEHNQEDNDPLALFASELNGDRLEDACELAVTNYSEDGITTDPADAAMNGYNLATGYPGRPFQVIKIGDEPYFETYFFVGTEDEVQARLETMVQPDTGE